MVIKIHHHRLVTCPLSTTPFPNLPSSSPSHLQPPASISPAQQRLIGQFDANHNQLTSATSIPNQRLDAIHTHIQTQDKTISDLSNAVRLDFQTSLRLILYLAEASHNFTSLEINLQFPNGRGISTSWTIGPWFVTPRRHWACLGENCSTVTHYQISGSPFNQ